MGREVNRVNIYYNIYFSQMNLLEKKFGSRLKKKVSLKEYTSFKIGGAAKYFLEVMMVEELVSAVKLARKEKLDYVILGGGSNVLMSDKGFGGVVLRMLDVRCEMLDDKTIAAGSGLSLVKLSEFALENSLTGLEWALGIPGTVGGAVVMNAGCFGREMKDVVHRVKYFDSHVRDFGSASPQIASNASSNNSNIGIKELTRKQCKFGYRESVFKYHPEWIVLEAELKLKKGKQEKIKKEIKELLDRRNEKMPREPSAGSVFKKYEIRRGEKLNPQLEKVLKKEHPEFLRGRYIPAGWLIEELGLKGKRIGGAMISEKHANFIVNTGKARAEQVIMLISLIKQKVRNNFGIQLQEEIIYLGFERYNANLLI